MTSDALHRLAFAVLLAGLVLASSAGHPSSVSAGAQPGGGSPPAANVASITPEQLLATALSPSDLQGLFPSDQPWWSGFPGLNVPPLRLQGGQGPGVRFYVTQEYTRLDQPNAVLEQSVAIENDSASAAADFASLLNTTDAGGTIAPGPALGDAQRYYTRMDSDPARAGLPDVTNESTVRVQVGPVIARLSLIESSGFETPDALARDAAPLVAKITKLLAGQLSAPAIDAGLLAALPPAVDGVGPVLGTAVLPPEAWVVADLDDPNSTDPVAEAKKDDATLRAGGVTQLVVRSYVLAAALDNTIDVTLFPFKDATSAASLVGEYAGQVTSNPSWSQLDAGQTGSASVFALLDGGYYDLEFANGSYAADISCSAPFDSTLLSPSCETAVRQVAEAWYASLSALAGR